MIGKILGNLKIIAKLGEGGMGVVYLAEHLTLKKYFAVKSLAATLTQNPGFSERFYQEAVHHAALDHPNIVHVTDYFAEDGQFFFVMEYVKGQALNDLIKKKGRLTEQEVLPIFKGILSGLDFAHSKGVIHRDVKPSNVIVDESGRARITDFGIAIMTGDKRLTATGANVGTSWYMSPEQILRPTAIDHRSDVYSAGIVLYEMLTGDVPFDGDSEYIIKHKQVQEVAPDPAKINADITPELKKMVLKALEKDPDKRYSGCGEFLQTIEAYEKASIPGKSGIHPLLYWLFALVALMVIAVAAFRLIENDRQPPIESVSAEKQRHESASIWIESATEKASILCQEIQELKLKQERLRLLKESLGDTAELDAKKQEIKDHENNIEEYLAGYQDYLTRLDGVEKAIFEHELNKYNERLAQKNLFARIKITQIVMRHYQEAPDDKTHVSLAALNGLCPQ